MQSSQNSYLYEDDRIKQTKGNELVQRGNHLQDKDLMDKVTMKADVLTTNFAGTYEFVISYVQSRK